MNCDCRMCREHPELELKYRHACSKCGALAWDTRIQIRVGDRYECAVCFYAPGGSRDERTEAR